MDTQFVASEMPRWTVAIVDDDESNVSMTKRELKRMGYIPFPIDSSFATSEDCAYYIASKAQAAICDHRLGYGGFADFDGATLVANLYDYGIPSVLITMYTMDIDVSIRKKRKNIPVLLGRNDISPSKLKEGLMICNDELRGKILPSRKPHRSLIQIKDITAESGDDVIDVIIPNWNPYIAVRFPRSLIPDTLQGSVAQGAIFFAQVNVGAEKSEDLYFENFELSPEPEDDDGLA